MQAEPFKDERSPELRWRYLLIRDALADVVRERCSADDWEVADALAPMDEHEMEVATFHDVGLTRWKLVGVLHGPTDWPVDATRHVEYDALFDDDDTLDGEMPK